MTPFATRLAGLALLAMSGIFFATSVATLAQTRPELVLKAAMDKESVEGDLKAAIDMYQKLSTSSDRTVAAKALVRLGQCYEKMGDANARKVYQAVVEKYPDQKDSLADAQRLLTALAGPTEPIRRRVWVIPPGRRLIGDVSAHGRYVAFTMLADGNSTVRSSDGSLWVHDLTTDRDHNIAPAQPGRWFPFGGPAVTVAFSPDGNQLAYGADSGSGFEVGVADIGRSSTKTIWREPTAGTELFARQIFWLTDGRHVAIRKIRYNGTLVSNVVVSVADGATENRPLDGDGFAYPSPDGRSRLLNTPKGILLGQESGGGTMLFPNKEAAEDVNAKWSADGRHVFFWSNRSGTDTWSAIGFVDGKLVGDAVEIKGPKTSAALVGSTRDGSLYYTEPNASNDVYELNLDPATGRELSAPRRVNQGIGGTVAGSGVMSADGQSVAHTVGEGGFSGNTTLVVRSVQTGVERTLPLGSVKARNVWEWFPDNRSVIVDDQAAEGRMSWRRVDVATGASTLLFELPQRDRPSAAVTLTPDGSTVFVTIQPRAGLTILRRNLTTGEQSVVFNAPGEDTLWPIKALSPDGLQLAFGSHAKDAYIVRTVPVAGGSAREVYRSTQETNLLGWTRDGRHLLIAQTDPASHLQELMSLPSGGGPAVRVGLALGRFGGRVTTLDGSRLLVSGTTPQTELWAATNLLGGTRK